MNNLLLQYKYQKWVKRKFIWSIINVSCPSIPGYASFQWCRSRQQCVTVDIFQGKRAWTQVMK